MENKTIIAFFLGAAIGSGITYLSVKRHFEDLANADISECREHYKKELENALSFSKPIESKAAEKIEDNVDTSGILKSNKTEVTKKEKIDYNKIIEKMNYGEFKGAKNEAPIEESDTPHVISDEEYDEDKGYEKEVLYYYLYDETFTDDCDNLLPEASGYIGEENLDNFGEYEDGVLYVRNPKRGTDYKVILDHSSYSESHDE